MTKQLEDLFDSFSDKTTEEQIEKVRQVRHTRSIERPAVAKRRQKKVRKKQISQRNKAEKLLDGMSLEEQMELLKAAKGE